MSDLMAFDVVVVGSGPAGQKAAIQAAKAGKRACVVEQEADVGGACVHRGTIPSKTLRETARHLCELRRRLGRNVKIDIPRDVQLASLMERVENVVARTSSSSRGNSSATASRTSMAAPASSIRTRWRSRRRGARRAACAATS